MSIQPSRQILSAPLVRVALRGRYRNQIQVCRADRERARAWQAASLMRMYKSTFPVLSDFTMTDRAFKDLSMLLAPTKRDNDAPDLRLREAVYEATLGTVRELNNARAWYLGLFSINRIEPETRSYGIVILRRCIPIQYNSWTIERIVNELADTYWLRLASWNRRIMYGCICQPQCKEWEFL